MENISQEDVVIFGDDILIKDKVRLDKLNKYELLILPDCPYLTNHQIEILCQFKGEILILGRFATHDLKGRRIEPGSDFLNRGNVCRLTGGGERKIIDKKIKVKEKTKIEKRFLHHIEETLLPKGLQIKIQAKNISCFIQRLSHEKSALHLINFNYDQVRDKIIPVKNVELKVRLPHRTRGKATLFSPDNVKKEIKLYGKQTNEKELRVRIHELKIYSIILII